MTNEGNGHSADGMALPSEYQEFVIGKKVIRVPELTLYELDLARVPILALDGSMWWADYAKTVCQIISILLPEQGDAESLYKKCSVGEARELSNSWGALLIKSGFEPPPGEAEAAVVEPSPGTGISTLSSQNLESGESVEEIRTLYGEPSR